MELTDKIRSKIRDVKDFPKEGILFKDITPLLTDFQLSDEIVEHIAGKYQGQHPEAVAGIEARGFFYGMLLAKSLKVPFIPIRKAGKLPYKTFGVTYDLEYGSASIEIHQDAVRKNMNVLIHDDLLATGGTARAAAELIEKSGGKVMAFSFIVELAFLSGAADLNKIAEVYSVISY